MPGPITNLPGFDFYTWTLARVGMAASLVKKGARPVAEVTVGNEYRDDVVEEIKRHQGVYWFADACGETHVSFYMYIYEHLGQIIKQLTACEMEDALGHWAWGHLFGYGEREIGAHIRKQAD